MTWGTWKSSLVKLTVSTIETPFVGQHMPLHSCMANTARECRMFPLDPPFFELLLFDLALLLRYLCFFFFDKQLSKCFILYGFVAPQGQPYPPTLQCFLFIFTYKEDLKILLAYLVVRWVIKMNFLFCAEKITT